MINFMAVPPRCHQDGHCFAVKTDKELYDEVVEYLNCVYVDLWNLRYLISLDMCPVDLRLKECEHYGNP